MLARISPTFMQKIREIFFDFGVDYYYPASLNLDISEAQLPRKTMSTPSKKKCKTSGNSVEGREFADDFITFLNESCTAFHTVEACVTRLQAAGFTRLMEGEDWEIKTMGKYFFTRNDSCLFCFTVGGAYVIVRGLMRSCLLVLYTIVIISHS